MPAHAEVYGFSNRWLDRAFENGVLYKSPDLSHRHVRAVEFLALKLEAFVSDDRQNAGDVYASRDVTDIATVLDGRPEIEAELSEAPDDLQETVCRGLTEIARKADLGEIVESHISPNVLTIKRIRLNVARWERMTA